MLGTALASAAEAPRDARDECAARLFEQGTHHTGRVMSRRALILGGAAALIAGAKYGGPPLHKLIFPPRQIHLTAVHGSDPEGMVQWADRGAQIALPTIPAGEKMDDEARRRFEDYLGKDAAAKLRTDAQIRGLFTPQEGIVLQIARSAVELERDEDLLGFLPNWVQFARSSTEIFPSKWAKAELFAAFTKHEANVIAALPEPLRKSAAGIVDAGFALVTNRPPGPEDKIKITFSVQTVRTAYRALLIAWWESRRETANSWEKRYIPPMLEAFARPEKNLRSALLAMNLSIVIEDALKYRAAGFVTASFNDGRDAYLVIPPDYSAAVEKELRARFPEALAPLPK